MSDKSTAEQTIAAALTELRKSCEAVQILVARKEPSGQVAYLETGFGSMLARLGHARDFALRMDERSRLQAKREFESEP